MANSFPKIPADPDAVFQTLREADGPLYWSDVCEILYDGLPSELPAMPYVRGVRDACLELVVAGLVEEVAPLKYAPTAAGRKATVLGRAIETTAG